MFGAPEYRAALFRRLAQEGRLEQEMRKAIELGAASWVKELYGDEIPDWATCAIEWRLAEIEKDLDG